MKSNTLFIIFILLIITNLSFCQTQITDSTSIKSDSINYQQKASNISILDKQKYVMPKSEVEVKIGQASRHMAYSWLVPLASFIVGAVVSKDGTPIGYVIFGAGIGLGIYYNVSGFVKLGKLRRKLRKETNF
jgi:hypothetical protein